VFQLLPSESNPRFGAEFEVTGISGFGTYRLIVYWFWESDGFSPNPGGKTTILSSAMLGMESGLEIFQLTRQTKR